MIDYELVRRRRLGYLLLLTHGQHFHLLLPLFLFFLLCFGIDDCLWDLWLFLFDNSSLELLYLTDLLEYTCRSMPNKLGDMLGYVGV